MLDIFIPALVVYIFLFFMLVALFLAIKEETIGMVSIPFIIFIPFFAYVAISDSMTFERLFNRINYKIYSKAEPIVKYYRHTDYGDKPFIFADRYLNIVKVENYGISTNGLTAEKSRENYRNYIKEGGDDTLKTTLIELIEDNQEILDALQQGIEIKYILSDRMNFNVDILITYQDVLNYWKSKNKSS